MKVLLDQEQCKQAIGSHPAGQNIEVSGKIKSGRYLTIDSPTSLSVLKGAMTSLACEKPFSLTALVPCQDFS